MVYLNINKFPAEGLSPSPSGYSVPLPVNPYKIFNALSPPLNQENPIIVKRTVCTVWPQVRISKTLTLMLTLRGKCEPEG